MVFARLYNIREPSSKILELLQMFAIEDLNGKPVSRLSSGENTRVGLCKALMNDPKLLLMDEPTAYLDPQLSIQVKKILLNMQDRCLSVELAAKLFASDRLGSSDDSRL
jgi:ABC-2 type transport system ATP-binding protein